MNDQVRARGRVCRKHPGMGKKMTIETSEIKNVMEKAMKLAKKYRKLTGKPLGITGEAGEYRAATLLGLQLMDARQPGYDAIGEDGRRIQIKSRCVPAGPQKNQRIGSIRFKHEWDTVMLVLMDEDYNPIEIFEALRDIVKKTLEEGDKAERERGAMWVRKFKAISRKIWPLDEEAP